MDNFPSIWHHFVKSLDNLSEKIWEVYPEPTRFKAWCRTNFEEISHSSSFEEIVKAWGTRRVSSRAYRLLTQEIIAFNDDVAMLDSGEVKPNNWRLVLDFLISTAKTIIESLKEFLSEKLSASMKLIFSTLKEVVEVLDNANRAGR